jgi:GT2 family glycosyltransferase
MVTPAHLPEAPSRASISVVLVVYNQIALTRACLDSLRATVNPFELCVIDNASTDATPEYFAGWTGDRPLRYHRNAENLGLIRALNQGAALAGGEALCFLHNDTEILDPLWLEKLQSAVGRGGQTGLAGLYGARRLRRDGRYAGRSIVHCLVARAPDEAQAFGSVVGRIPGRGVTEVAAVDGVCLYLPRAVFLEIGGFDERYGFFHGYDRDLSFAVRATGRRCVVVDAPFVHRGGGTRTGPSAPVGPPADLAQRRAALARFAEKWKHALPADVRSLRDRLVDGLGRLRTQPLR